MANRSPTLVQFLYFLVFFASRELRVNVICGLDLSIRICLTLALTKEMGKKEKGVICNVYFTNKLLKVLKSNATNSYKFACLFWLRRLVLLLKCLSVLSTKVIPFSPKRHFCSLCKHFFFVFFPFLWIHLTSLLFHPLPFQESGNAICVCIKKKKKKQNFCILQWRHFHPFCVGNSGDFVLYQKTGLYET